MKQTLHVHFSLFAVLLVWMHRQNTAREMNRETADRSRSLNLIGKNSGPPNEGFFTLFKTLEEYLAFHFAGIFIFFVLSSLLTLPNCIEAMKVK